MLFKLKKRCGNHYQNGKRYKAGDKIESSLDLCLLFPNKFDRMYEAEKKTGIAETDKPNIPPPIDKDEDKKKREETKTLPLSKYGEDVTEEFPTAKEVEVKIFEKSKWYVVIDEVDGEILNEKKLREKEVEPFLRQYLNDEDNLDEE